MASLSSLFWSLGKWEGALPHPRAAVVKAREGGQVAS